jgi:diadenosine tetraphosphatase ApaH/serine/threonine PP2A family protein phosphatase
LLKALYRERITLLRGNHESAQLCAAFGLKDECDIKYGVDSAEIWLHITTTFNYLPLSAIVGQHYFCVHGGFFLLVLLVVFIFSRLFLASFMRNAGLSPDILTVDQIRLLNRSPDVLLHTFSLHHYLPRSAFVAPSLASQDIMSLTLLREYDRFQDVPPEVCEFLDSPSCSLVPSLTRPSLGFRDP